MFWGTIDDAVIQSQHTGNAGMDLRNGSWCHPFQTGERIRNNLQTMAVVYCR